jgi:hypothetical protein
MLAEKVVLCAGCAAFSRGPNGRITAWNKGAERLLERSANRAVDRKCYHVIAGQDQIGTYCSERCPTWRLALEGQQIKPYILSVKTSRGRRVEVEFVTLVSDEESGLNLIHLLYPLEQAEPVYPEHEDDAVFDAIRLPLETGGRQPAPRALEIVHQLSIGRDCAEIARRLDQPERSVWRQLSGLVETLDHREPRA